MMRIMKLVCVLASIAIGVVMNPVSHPLLASAPQLKAQVPGWYRFMVGSYEVTALRDGYLNFDTKLIQHTNAAEIANGMEKAFIKNGSSIPTSINAFLINTGEKLVLIDAGTAKLFGPTLGFVADNLKASGYDPSQVDLILLTHLHGDHANGILTADNKVAFPNAQVMTTVDEVNFWLNKDKIANASKDLAPFFQMANAAVAPYLAAGKFTPFKANTEVSAGIKAVPMAVGHTPGHTGFIVESNGEKLIVTGDVVHVASLQFSRPEISVAYDLDDKSAIASRKRFFAQIAKEKTMIASSHLPFPGVGHIRAEGHGYVWIPMEYAALN